MIKQTVHYIRGISTHKILRDIRFDYACKRTNVVAKKGQKPILRFTNHKPDVTCKQCLKAMEGEG